MRKKEGDDTERASEQWGIVSLGLVRLMKTLLFKAQCAVKQWLASHSRSRFCLLAFRKEDTVRKQELFLSLLWAALILSSSES